MGEYLSKDHSLTNNSITHEENNPIDAIEDCYRLSEREESVLVQVFVACLKLILADPLSRDKKKVCFSNLTVIFVTSTISKFETYLD